MTGEPAAIELPQPAHEGKLSVETALLARRSIRDYRDAPLELNEAGQLLWAAQGQTRPGGYRTCPSAGALYPLELYLVAGKVNGLGAGNYRYDPGKHLLVQSSAGDLRRHLAEAALGQSMIGRAPATLAICAVFERTTGKYGQRGVRYVFMEAGHAAQNVSLQAVSLNLGTVVIGAFRDEKVKEILGLKPEEEPLYLMPVGR
jgi:SagB-type dehydrogenase family enzyme